MITEKRYKLLVWLVIVLIVLNVSTLGTLLYQHIFEPTNLKKACSVKLCKDTDNKSNKCFRSSLKLDEKQCASFDVFNKPFREKIRVFTGQLAEKRATMLELLANDKTDTVALNQISTEIGLIHRDIKINTYKYYLDIKQICNAEQQQILKTLFGVIFQTVEK